MFAARDISQGDVVELAPSLPLEGDAGFNAGILELSCLACWHASQQLMEIEPNLCNDMAKMCPKIQSLTKHTSNDQ